MTTTHFADQQKVPVEYVARDRKYQILTSRLQKALIYRRQQNSFLLEGPVA